jgi:hypothetical protein
MKFTWCLGQLYDNEDAGIFWALQCLEHQAR